MSYHPNQSNHSHNEEISHNEEPKPLKAHQTNGNFTSKIVDELLKNNEEEVNDSPFKNIKQTILSKKDALPIRTMEKVVLDTSNSSLSSRGTPEKEIKVELKDTTNSLKPPIEPNLKIMKKKIEEDSLKIESKVEETKEKEEDAPKSKGKQINYQLNNNENKSSIIPNKTEERKAIPQQLISTLSHQKKENTTKTISKNSSVPNINITSAHLKPKPRIKLKQKQMVSYIFKLEFTIKLR